MAVLDAPPGAESFPQNIVDALVEVRRQEAPGEHFATRHLQSDGTPKYTNRLLLEGSPYLREHAHNPVNWYPWGDEAFDTARRLGRPVLLSIGYSTCHWCHVMEEESFEDEEIARYLNEHYVAIKVDREQRPDLDSIYMAAVQAVTGRGGWPMTLWLTPEREPFHAGTYFPARDGDRGGSRGFLPLLTRLSELYGSDLGTVTSKAAELASRVRSALAPTAGGAHASIADGAHKLPAQAAHAAAGKAEHASPAPRPGEVPSTSQATTPTRDEIFETALAATLARFDPDHGGTRGAPKFPSALPLGALLRQYRISGDARALDVVTKTLDAMADGGIHDQLGGGFHRYSTDATWTVPHFEKMLYDNALLAMVYLEAWQVTHRDRYAEVAKDILAWTEREMTSADGAFFSATDADSPAPGGKIAEGWFFTWTPTEVAAVLGNGPASLFDQAYGVTPVGNLDGRSVLHLIAPVEELARQWSRSPDEIGDELAKSRSLLLQARAKRTRPRRDDKIVTAWNALMISAFAKASVVLGDDRDREIAARAADNLIDGFERRGHLVRSRLGEQEQREAFLDDYAFLEAALLDLFEAGDGDRRLHQALALDAVVEREFEDASGGFFLTPARRSDLLVREKSLLDGAEPSGSSVAMLNELRLAELTSEGRYRERADRALGATASTFASSPLSIGHGLVALDFAGDTPKEIVLVTKDSLASLASFLRVLGVAFVPNRVVVIVSGDDPAAGRLALAEGKIAIDDQPTAYVCEAHVCDLPTRDAALFRDQVTRTRTHQGTPVSPSTSSGKADGRPSR